MIIPLIKSKHTCSLHHKLASDAGQKCKIMIPTFPWRCTLTTDFKSALEFLLNDQPNFCNLQTSPHLLRPGYWPSSPRWRLVWEDKGGVSKKKIKIDWRGQMNGGINLQKLRGRVSKILGALPGIAGGEDIFLISLKYWQQYTLNWSRPNMRCMTKYSNYMAYFWIQERLQGIYKILYYLTMPSVFFFFFYLFPTNFYVLPLFFFFLVQLKNC